MDFGYDEFGRRTGQHQSHSADKVNSNTNINGKENGNNKYRLHKEDNLPGTSNNNNSNSNSISSNSGDDVNDEVNIQALAINKNKEPMIQEQNNHDESDFDEDVELIVGESGMQSIDEPLVAPSSLATSSLASSTTNAHVHHNEYSRFALIRSAPAPLNSQDSSLSSKLIGTSKTLQLTSEPSTSHKTSESYTLQERYLESASSLFRSSSSAPLLSRMSVTEAKLEYIHMLLRMPARLRCAALIGGLHHGKTSLLEMLLNGKSYEREPDEVNRGMTLHSHVISTVINGNALQPATHVFTLIDTPGHASLFAEVFAAIRLVDVVCVVVDAVEGWDGHTERLLRHTILYEQLPVILIVNKLDRLITELKLPPLDAYRKLRTIIDSCNNIIASCNAPSLLVSPEAGTVCFASCELGFMFSLETFALKYTEVYGKHHIDPFALSQQLWGQVTFEKNKFIPITKFNQRPSFVTFVLEPIYKIIAHAATGNGAELLCNQLHSQPNSPLDAIREAMRFFCGNPAEDGMDILLNVLPHMQPRVKWLRSHYHLNHSDRTSSQEQQQLELEELKEEKEKQEEEEESFELLRNNVYDDNNNNNNNNTAMAIGTLMRAWSEFEMAAIVRVVRGTLHLIEHKQAIVIDSLCNELEPFKQVNITGMYMIASESVCTESISANSHVPNRIDHSVEEEKRDGRARTTFPGLTRKEANRRRVNHEVERLIALERVYEGQIVLITGLDRSNTNNISGNSNSGNNTDHINKMMSNGNITELVNDFNNTVSNHFVLVAGDVVNKLLHSSQYNNEEQETSDDDEDENENDNDSHTERNKAEEHQNEEIIHNIQLYPFATVDKPLIHTGIELKQVEKMQLLQRGLRNVLQGTHGIDIRTEETGEFTMSGHGELQLDGALQELRQRYCQNVKIGLSQPYVSFRETVLDTCGVLAHVGNRKTGIACTSGLLNSSLAHVLEYGELDVLPIINAYNKSVWSTSHFNDNYLQNDQDKLRNSENVIKIWTTLRTEYHMDALEVRRLMAIGPDKTHGPSILLDDTLAEEDVLQFSASYSLSQLKLRSIERSYDAQSQTLSRNHRNAIITAFRAATAAGPLIGDTVHGVAVKLIYSDIDPSARVRDAVVLSTARNSIRQSLFGARPRLLEPVFNVEILTSPECVSEIRDILQQRRGAVVSEEAIPATPLLRLRGLVPVIDSFGLETQIRALTHGQAFPSFSFAQWDRVPGDPFDSTIQVAPLEPAKGYQLARDFVLKTRFRRGLPLKLLSEL